MIELSQLKDLGKKAREAFFERCISGIEHFIMLEIAKGNKMAKISQGMLKDYIIATYSNNYISDEIIEFINAIKPEIRDHINKCKGFESYIWTSAYDASLKEIICVTWE